MAKGHSFKKNIFLNTPLPISLVLGAGDTAVNKNYKTPALTELTS